MHHKQSGFTLLETMIYISLFGLLMSGALVSVFSLIDGGNRNKSAIAIQEEGTFLNRKINWALTGATGVTAIGSTGISIDRPDLGAGSPVAISSGASGITIKRGGSSALLLNSDSFIPTNVVFIVVPAASSRPTSVSVSFLIKDRPFVFKTYLRQ